MTVEQYPKVYLYQRIVQAKLFMDSHYANKIDVRDIADEAYFSKFHFIRIFKKIYGKTPHQYLTGVRMEKAVGLLRKNHSVAVVCYAVGFESLSSFSGLFKRMVGLSPSSFAVQQKRVMKQISETPLKFIPSCYASQNGWGK